MSDTKHDMTYVVPDQLTDDVNLETIWHIIVINAEKYFSNLPQCTKEDNRRIQRNFENIKKLLSVLAKKNEEKVDKLNNEMLQIIEEQNHREQMFNEMRQNIEELRPDEHADNMDDDD